MEEIEAVPEPEPIAVNGGDKNDGKLEQEEEEEERVEDLIETVEPEEIERESNSIGDTTAGAATATHDAGDSDQELDELLDGIASSAVFKIMWFGFRGSCMWKGKLKKCVL